MKNKGNMADYLIRIEYRPKNSIGVDLQTDFDVVHHSYKPLDSYNWFYKVGIKRLNQDNFYRIKYISEIGSTKSFSISEILRGEE